MRGVYIALLTVAASQGLHAQVKPAKRWETISLMFSITPDSAMEKLTKLKFEISPSSKITTDGWVTVLDRRTLYMAPDGGMMHDSILMLYENSRLMLVNFMYGNDNGDPEMAGNDLDLLCKDLKRDKYQATIKQPNEYAEKRTFTHADAGLTISADLWLQQEKPVSVRMQVFRNGVDPSLVFKSR